MSVSFVRTIPPLAAALCACAVVSFTPATAGAQAFGSFGKNKIHYRDFDWHVLRGEHVDVYYYPAEEPIARVALSYAEESYDHLAGRLSHEVRTRIPLIVYASHNDFEQTNVLPFVPPEGILGVTEFMKRRVALPFRGSYAEFRHTLRHELVHVFQLSIVQQQLQAHPNARGAGVPLWWSEGLAEYLSADQDTRDVMVVRDLVLSGRLPSIAQLNEIYSAIAYPLGGELHHFLAARYGEWRVMLVYEMLLKYQSFEEAVSAAYGRSLDELSAEWQYAMRQRFFPAVAGRKPLTVAGRRVTELAVKPVPVVDHEGEVSIAYLSPRSGYTDIYGGRLDGRGDAEILVKGERTPEFENLHPFSSRIDARDGVLLFASKYNDRDALVFWSLAEKRVVGRYQFDGIVSILSPAFSPDGRRVAFSGLAPSGVSDLYVLELGSGELRRITDDVYEDLDPIWLPSGATLVFSSDRAVGGDMGCKNLYRVDLATSAVRPLTAGAWIDETPRWDAETGRILFVSDRDGSLNLYSIDTLGHGRRETRLDGGVFDPAPIPGDERILVGGYGGLQWSVYTVAPDPEAHSDTFSLALDDSASLASASGAWEWRELADPIVVSAEPERYRSTFSLDMAVGGAEVGPGSGTGQGGQFVFTDMLGDHAIFGSITAPQARRVDQLLSNLNGNVFYLNRSDRLNWGAGAFRISGLFYGPNFGRVYRETSGGVYGLVRYPLSRFMRVEGQTRIEYSNREDFNTEHIDGPARRKGMLVSNFISIVGDNSLWLPTGPIDGTRWNFTAGVVGDLSRGAFENWVGSADVRRYIRTSQETALALRGFGYASEGTRPRAIQVGGSWMLRGYPRHAVDGTRAWLINTEWRFPLARFVAVGLPFGAVRLPPVQAAAFGDLGQAWYAGEYDQRVLGSWGIGFRSPVGPGFVVRVDVGKRFSFLGNESASAEFYRRRFVDVFFGFNY